MGWAMKKINANYTTTWPTFKKGGVANLVQQIVRLPFIFAFYDFSSFLFKPLT